MRKCNESHDDCINRQAACEYCHEDSDGYVRPIEKNSHAWLVRQGRTMKLRVCFKGEHRECDILFCPMCGRRLVNGRCDKQMPVIDKYKAESEK